MSRWDLFTIIVMVILFIRAIAIFLVEEKISIKKVMKEVRRSLKTFQDSIRKIVHGNKKNIADRRDKWIF